MNRIKDIVRMANITIEGIKNVNHGTIQCIPTRAYDKAKSLDEKIQIVKQMSLRGIYGQNGSGKSALVNALSIVKYLMTGQSIPNDAIPYIAADREQANISVEFKILLDGTLHDVDYEVTLQKVKQATSNIVDTNHYEYRLGVAAERLTLRTITSDRIKRKNNVIDVDGDEVIVNKTICTDLFGQPIHKLQEALIIDRKVTNMSGRSFIFSRELLSRIDMSVKTASARVTLEGTTNKNNVSNQDDTYNKNSASRTNDVANVLRRLVLYANRELYIIPSTYTGMVNMNLLPLGISMLGDGEEAVGMIPLELDQPAAIPIEILPFLYRLMDTINVVLPQIIPGLTLRFHEHGAEFNVDGQTIQRVECISVRDGQEIPFKYESDGIKKLVSLLQLLITVYNRTSVTVVVDELDSGIFEYLLGEILLILSQGAKGQLMFTSHNLRPLEVLPSDNLLFTTTDVNHRYTTMKGIKRTNNMRDCYYRDILLDTQDFELYKPTNNSEIAMAFRKAGE